MKTSDMCIAGLVLLLVIVLIFFKRREMYTNQDVTNLDMALKTTTLSGDEQATFKKYILDFADSPTQEEISTVENFIRNNKDKFPGEGSDGANKLNIAVKVIIGPGLDKLLNQVSTNQRKSLIVEATAMGESQGIVEATAMGESQGIVDGSRPPRTMMGEATGLESQSRSIPKPPGMRTVPTSVKSGPTVRRAPTMSVITSPGMYRCESDSAGFRCTRAS